MLVLVENFTAAASNYVRAANVHFQERLPEVQHFPSLAFLWMALVPPQAQQMARFLWPLPVSPHLGWSFQMGSAYQFHSWRVFVLVCAFPSVAAISALTTMPESPRFYLEVSLSQCAHALCSIFQSPSSYSSFIYFRGISFGFIFSIHWAVQGKIKTFAPWWWAEVGHGLN